MNNREPFLKRLTDMSAGLYWSNLRMPLLRGVLVGLTTGLIIGLFRWTHNLAYAPVHALAKTHPLGWWLFIVIAALIIGLVMDRLPQVRSSGIPVVETAEEHDIRFSWLTILWTKFVGTWLGLLAGLSIGREGPSIEMGAAVGLGVSKALERFPTLREVPTEPDTGATLAHTRHNSCFLSGAGAGLSAAFGAPLGGLAFVVEEMRCRPTGAQGLSMLATLSAAVLVADLSLVLFGLGRMFPFENAASLPLPDWWLLLPLSLCFGLAGAGYNAILLFLTRAYTHAPFPPFTRALLPMVTAGFLLFYGPNLLAGGEVIILSLPAAPALSLLTMLLVGKLLFSLLCAASSVPGGLLMPMLCLGGMMGSLCVRPFLPDSGSTLSPETLQMYAIVGMSGFFAASVRAPITGALLTIQMTGAYVLTPIAIITALISGKVADCLKSEPIYEALRELNK